MRGWLYVLVFVFCGSTCHVQAQDSLVGVEYNADTLNQRDDKGKKHGWWVHTYSRDRLKSTIYYEHGKKWRWAHYYFKDGRLKESGEWCDNIKDGLWIYFTENKPEKTEYVTYNSKKVMEVIKVWDYGIPEDE